MRSAGGAAAPAAEVRHRGQPREFTPLTAAGRRSAGRVTSFMVGMERARVAGNGTIRLAGMAISSGATRTTATSLSNGRITYTASRIPAATIRIVTGESN